MSNADQNAPFKGSPVDSGFCPLPDLGVIFVEGPDAASFLQNQLTNSVLGLRRTFYPDIACTSAAIKLIGYCTPKGRLIASAWLALVPREDSADDRFVLFISKDIAANIAKRLSMYVLRSKVKVIDATQDWRVLGFCSPLGQPSFGAVDEMQISIQLPDVQVYEQTFIRVLVAQPHSVNSIDCQNGVLDTWNDLEVLSGIPRIVQATQEQFVPQMINFESVAGVDFKKGCYPGQEIVARSQYRGVIKRRLSLAHLSSDQLHGAPFGPGVELFHSEDDTQPAGMVVLSAQSVFEPHRIDFQVECKLEALDHGEIRLGSSSGPVLKIDVLPYPLIDI